jgi:hypothetical protein
MTDYASYALRLKSGNPDIFLGSLAWYAVSESTTISHDRLKKLLTDAGISTDGVAPPKDDDVFRRVCSAVQENGKGLATGNGTFIRVLLRDVKRQAREVHKQLVLEEIDANNETLDFTTVAKVVFRSLGNVIDVTPIDPSPYPNISDTAIDAIQKGFVQEQGKHNAYAVRELIRRELTSAHATLVRPTGGVYFVLRGNAAALDAVIKFGESIQGVSVHALPLIDDGKQREMVKDAVEGETVLEIDRLCGEIDKLLAGPEISTNRFQALMSTTKGIDTKTESYSDLLEDSLNKAEARRKVLKAKMRKLFDHVK